MSRKLLAVNTDTAQVEVPLPTVSKGLVCFLDGRRAGSGSVWEDLSGFGKHAYYSSARTPRGVIFQNNGMYFQKSGDVGATINNAIKGMERYAIEITFQFTGDFEAGVFGLDTVGLHLQDEIYAGIGTVLPVPMDFLNVNFRQKTTVLITFNNEDLLTVYSNGAYEFKILRNSAINTCTNIILGCDKAPNEDNHIGTNGKGGLYIYSFKVYNRVLTEDEIARSYEEEKLIQRM